MCQILISWDSHFHTAYVILSRHSLLILLLPEKAIWTPVGFFQFLIYLVHTDTIAFFPLSSPTAKITSWEGGTHWLVPIIVHILLFHKKQFSEKRIKWFPVLEAKKMDKKLENYIMWKMLQMLVLFNLVKYRYCWFENGLRGSIEKVWSFNGGKSSCLFLGLHSVPIMLPTDPNWNCCLTWSETGLKGKI